jgi:hypothetical protein
VEEAVIRRTYSIEPCTLEKDSNQWPHFHLKKLEKEEQIKHKDTEEGKDQSINQ